MWIWVGGFLYFDVCFPRHVDLDWPCHLHPSTVLIWFWFCRNRNRQIYMISCGEGDTKKPNGCLDKSLKCVWFFFFITGFCVDFQMTIISFQLRTSVLFGWCTAQFRLLHADWCLPQTETGAMRLSSLRLDAMKDWINQKCFALTRCRLVFLSG